MCSDALLESPQKLELEDDYDNEASNHQVGKRMAATDMQNYECDYHQHDSNKQNVSLPFEEAKTHAANTPIVFLLHRES